MNSACKRVKWTVDNPNIASVDERGIVKGIKQGVTSVIVEVEGYDGNVFKATCQVNVTKGNRRFFIILVVEMDGRQIILCHLYIRKMAITVL